MTAMIGAAALGVLSWSLLEYLLHRFVFHGPYRRALGAPEHRRHHAEVDWFAPWYQKGAAALAATALALPLAWWAAGPAAGGIFTGAFVASYVLYEWLHRRAHTHAPRGAYGRWLRRNHFAHHFRDPRRAHGVTTPIWDYVFGTRLPMDRLRIPRRLAMSWLVDEEGNAVEQFTGDYELIGSARPTGPS